MTKRTISKAGRLMLLYRMREAGITDDLTLQDMGEALGVNRSTIMRDLRELDEVEAEYRHLIATQPWVQREFSTSEFAHVINISPDTVRAMIADGLIAAVKRDEQWRISLGEVQRWREIVHR